MKKHHYLLALAAFALLLTVPAVTRAEDDIDDDSGAAMTGSAVTVTPTPLTSPGSTTPEKIRERLREDSRVQASFKFVPREDEDQRNGLIKSVKPIISSRASTSDRVLMLGATRQNIENNIRKEIFDNQREKLVRELKRSLDNLMNVRDRIKSRIEKAQDSGRDMTAARAALVLADAKLSAAKTAVKVLSELDLRTILAPSTSISPTPTASTTSGKPLKITLIDLAKPRQIGADAIKAVQEAKRALNDVVVAIAHAMGLKVGQDGKIEVTPTPTASASPTVSVSPSVSVSPTVSVTPSATPTASVTPSATPTATP